MSLCKRSVGLIVLLTVALFAAGCPQRETISKINADPGRYSNKEVAVAGTVTDGYGLLNYGVYEIDDGTGKLLIVTQRSGVPSRGSKVGVKGRIYTGASYGGRSFGTVLEESARRAK
ncbi:MAG TPA: hypothetical protein VGO69_10200 [Pyrinomonadaceae bacterium]|nr:hypothetical protein [Pyrinomonadaceae bacterium]